MMEDAFERRLTDAAQEYHRPPATPREEIWGRITAVRATRRQRARAPAPRLRWGVGIAALLALGIGIGRWSVTPSTPSTGSPGPQAGKPASTLPYQVAAVQHLSRTETLLTGFRADTRAGDPAQFAAQARDLLVTTRLMLDSPAADDPRLKNLLEDLELVLAQIAQLPEKGAREDVQLINQGLDQRSVLLRLRTAIPAGSGAAGTQGAL